MVPCDRNTFLWDNRKSSPGAVLVRVFVLVLIWRWSVHFTHWKLYSLFSRPPCKKNATYAHPPPHHPAPEWSEKTLWMQWVLAHILFGIRVLSRYSFDCKDLYNVLEIRACLIQSVGGGGFLIPRQAKNLTFKATRGLLYLKSGLNCQPRFTVVSRFC